MADKQTVLSTHLLDRHSCKVVHMHVHTNKLLFQTVYDIHVAPIRHLLALLRQVHLQHQLVYIIQVNNRQRTQGLPLSALDVHLGNYWFVFKL